MGERNFEGFEGDGCWRERGEYLGGVGEGRREDGEVVCCERDIVW